MPIIQCALMCHAPIVIPAIGGSRAPQCEGTTVAMRQVAAGIVAAEPDVLVIVSPHTPRQGSAWGIAAGRQLRGDFGRFGHPEVAVGLPGAPDAAAEVVRAAEAAGLRCAWLPPQLLAALDHGALVPLHFLAAAGFSGPTLLVSLPMPGAREHARFGAALSSAADAAEQRWVVLASGDMSHRVIEGAPAGFHPRGKVFDAGFRAALQAGDGRAAVSPDPSLRELAAEDVVDSTAVALGAADFRMAAAASCTTRRPLVLAISRPCCSTLLRLLPRRRARPRAKVRNSTCSPSPGRPSRRTSRAPRPRRPLPVPTMGVAACS